MPIDWMDPHLPPAATPTYSTLTVVQACLPLPGVLRACLARSADAMAATCSMKWPARSSSCALRHSFDSERIQNFLSKDMPLQSLE